MTEVILDGIGSKKWEEAWQKAHNDKVTPQECNCFDTEKGFELLPTTTIRPIKIWSKAQGRWNIEDCVEHEDLCPVCFKLLLVRAVKGTTYLACCSKECYNTYNTWRKEHGLG